jgi:hypothetical protein
MTGRPRPRTASPAGHVLAQPPGNREPLYVRNSVTGSDLR